LEQGYRVRVLDTLLFGNDSVAALQHNSRFDLTRADFRHLDAVVKAVRDMDGVIHLGAIVGDPACKLDSQTSLETNLAATAMIRSVCCGAGIQRFLFASTCSVYGASDGLLDERSGPNPISLYACTKLGSERLLLGKQTEGFMPTVLRLGTAFGWSERPRFDLLVNLLTAQALCEGQIAIFNPSQWRPFIHVQDIARAFVTCVQAPLPLVAYETFNVGSDEMNARLGQLASLVKTQIPRVRIDWVEVAADRRNYRVRFDKIQKTLGFRCVHGLEYGISEIKNAIESARVVDYNNPRYYNHRTLEHPGARASSNEAAEPAIAWERFLRGPTPVRNQRTLSSLA
jgi:nucleoside-diphosphate-sugar epimerase